jgi:hypothetical protein
MQLRSKTLNSFLVLAQFAKMAKNLQSSLEKSKGY